MRIKMSVEMSRGRVACRPRAGQNLPLRIRASPADGERTGGFFACWLTLELRGWSRKQFHSYE